MKQTAKLVLSTTLVILLTSFSRTDSSVYDEIGWLPKKEMHLVYDFYGILSDEQTAFLEERLVAFNDSTSNQIAVVFTPAFGGRDISSFAFELGDEWGIGQGSLNNGVIIVIKPKDDTDGQVEIAPGLGLEGALPDIFCKRIIEDVMIPHFREDDYFGAVSEALDIIIPVCAGEYSYKQYKDDNDISPLATLIITILVIAAICWLVHKGDKKTGGGFGSGYGGTYYGGNTRVSGWGGSSWGGSSGHSGGFGGFGGGSFGGGGASGRW